MKRKTGILLAIAVFSCAPELLAQRGRGNGNFHSEPFRPVVRMPSPNLGGRPYPIRTDLPTPTGLIAPAASYTGISPGGLQSVSGDGYGGGRPGNRGGYVGGGFIGGGYGGYGIPFLPYANSSVYSSFPSYSEQAEATTAQINSQMQDALAHQVEQMNAEIRELREAQFRNGAPLARQPEWVPPPAPLSPTASEPPTPQPPIILVLQSGGQMTVTNYAVMNGTIWDFSKTPAHKIPVSTVNLEASERATEATGAEFPHLPAH